MCKNRRARQRAISSAVLFAAGLITIESPRRAAGQSWINPNGGSWNNPANWSTDSVPTSASADAYFTLGSQVGYTVTNIGPVNAISVEGDDPTLNFGGYFLSGYPGVISVSSVAGQTSTLTLMNGSVEGYSGPAYVSGSGGTCTLNTDNFTLIGYMTGAVVGGPAGSVANYNQVGGSLVDEGSQGIEFGNGAGQVNVAITGGLISAFAFVDFGPSGTTTAYLNSTTFGTYQNNFPELQVGAGTGTATVAFNASGGAFNVADIGTADHTGGYGSIIGIANIPQSGGGVGTLTLGNNSSIGAYSVLIGTSRGTGTVIGSGTGCGVDVEGFFALGDNGIGVLALSGGSNLTLEGPDNFIGGSGGNARLTLSGVGTNCTCKFSSIGRVAGNNVVNIGYDGVSNGIGMVELDHGATLTASPFAGQGSNSEEGIVALGTEGTLEVLSGSRVTTTLLTEVPGSTLEIGLDGPLAADNGQIAITSLATFAGTLDVVFENGFQPTIGEQFQLFTLGGETGQFSAIDVPAGYSFDSTNLYTTGTITVTAVPEPAAAAGLGLIAISSLGRRRAGRARTRNHCG